MAWKEPSQAERQLRAHLASRGLSVSWAKIRRWREFGALPWEKRQGLGRGSGSVSALVPDTVVVAEALALATAKKKPLEGAVLQVFAAHPRFGQILAVPPIPLPEHAIRRALAWYITRGDSQLPAVIGRAVESVDGNTEQAMDAALESAHRHFLKLYRQANRGTHRDGSIGPYAPHSVADADGLATFAVAIVLSFEEFGADAIMEALGKSFPEFVDEYGEKVWTELQRVALEAEVNGKSPFSRRLHWPSATDRVRTMEQVEFSTICTVRNVLTVLVEAAPALDFARRTGLEDPAVRHVEKVRASNQRTDEYLTRAAAICRLPAERSWKGFTGLLLDVCATPRLSTFQEDTTCLDPAFDDILGLSQRVRQLPRNAAANSIARCEVRPTSGHASTRPSMSQESPIHSFSPPEART